MIMEIVEHDNRLFILLFNKSSFTLIFSLCSSMSESEEFPNKEGSHSDRKKLFEVSLD